VTTENTTGSTPTTETPPAAEPSAEQASPSSSQTDQSQQPADDDAAPGTLLTSPAESDKDADADADKGADKEADADADADKDADPAAKFLGAPEGDYELSGLPEGTEIDAEALAAVAPVAKELNLSNEGLSKIAGVYAEKVLPGVVDRVQEGIMRDVSAQHAAWASEAVELVKTDPVFEGKPLADVQRVSAKALDRFFGPEFRTFLDQTGLGNHPQMLKGMYTVGSRIAEDDTFERGGSPAAKPKSRTELYYGGDGKK
jgi:hypothetical protein